MEINEQEEVYCIWCRKGVIPKRKGGRWRCPLCNKFIRIEKERAKPQDLLEESSTEELREIIPAKSIILSGQELEMARLLVKTGEAKNLNDVIKKSLKIFMDNILERELDKPTEKIKEELKRKMRIDFFY